MKLGGSSGKTIAHMLATDEKLGRLMVWESFRTGTFRQVMMLKRYGWTTEGDSVNNISVASDLANNRNTAEALLTALKRKSDGGEAKCCLDILSNAWRINDDFCVDTLAELLMHKGLSIKVAEVLNSDKKLEPLWENTIRVQGSGDSILHVYVKDIVMHDISGVYEIQKDMYN